MPGSGKRQDRGGIAALVTLALCFALAPAASADPPTHPRTPALDVEGLNKACGAAVDSEGNVYAASPGEDKIKIFGPADHVTPLASLEDTHQPCGLAVDSRGDLFALQAETGEVVRYVPDAYPFEGAPTYGEAEVIDASGQARGIAVDTGELWSNSNRAMGADDTLFVAKGDRVEAWSNEAQRVQVSGFATGTYRLCFEGECTEPLPAGASHEAVQEALEALPAIGEGNVAVTTANFGATDHRITFTHRLGLADVERLEADTSALSGSLNPALLRQGGLGTDEEQQIELSSATGGSFTLTFDGQTTAAIKHDASAAKIQEALEALSNLEAGDIVVRLPRATSSLHLFSLTFEGAYAATDVPQIEATSSLEPNPGAELVVSTVAAGWSGRIGEGELTEAAGLAAYSHPVEGEGSDRYLFAADAASDRIEVFAAASSSGATKLADLAPRAPIEGPGEGEGFEFGPAGAYLAADPGNALEEKTLKCTEPVGEQACSAGHLIVYDAAREEVEEFDASGRFLDSFGAAGLADAEPSALAIERSGGATDGTIYAGSDAGAGASLLAFGPLKAPFREVLPAYPAGLSRTLESAEAVATDSFGNVYVAAGSTVHVYGTGGEEVTSFGLEKPTGSGIEVSTASSSSKSFVLHSGSPSSAFSAETRTTGRSSPGNS